MHAIYRVVLALCFNLEGKDLYCNTAKDYLPLINGNGKDEALPVVDLTALPPFVIRRSFPAFNVMVDYDGSYSFTSCERRRFRVTVTNSHTQRQQQWARITLYAPPEVGIVGGRSTLLPLNNLWGSKAETEFCVDAPQFDGAKLELVVDVSLEGRHSAGQVKLVLMRAIDTRNCGDCDNC